MSYEDYRDDRRRQEEYAARYQSEQASEQTKHGYRNLALLLLGLAVPLFWGASVISDGHETRAVIGWWAFLTVSSVVIWLIREFRAGFRGDS